MRYLLIASLCVGFACGDDDDDDDDVVVIDAAVVIFDDGAFVDAPASSADAAGPDAAAPDAAPPDGAPVCGTIGKPCDLKGDDCDKGQICQFSIGGDFCTKNRPACGGFAGDTCDDPAAPLCHFLPGADIGPCLSAFERDCICEISPGSIIGCP